MRSIVINWAARLLSLALIALLPGQLHAQGMDQLFREFNSQFESGSYTLAERTARRMVQNSTSESWTAAALNSLGRTLNAQRRYAEAVPHFERALQIPLNATNINRGWIPNNLGNSYRHLKKYDEAERVYRRALAEFEAMHGARSESVASVRSNVGWIYHAREQYDKAAEEQKAVLTLRRELLGESDSDVGSSYNAVGSSLTDGGHLTEGREYLEKALAIKKVSDGPEAGDVAVILNNLAENASKQGMHDVAERQARESLAIREKLFGRNSLIVSGVLEDLSKYLEKGGKTDESKQIAEEAKQIEEALASGGASPENPFRVGQTIQVSVAQASVMDAGAAIGSLTKGMELKVIAINGRWCGVKIAVGGKERTGWLDSNQATTPAAAAAAVKPLELAKEVVSSEGRFKIKMPQVPKLAKQTVNGVTHNSYTLELGQGTFIAGYFDVPAGFMLTFEAGIQAFAGARKGAVESEKRISLQDEFPGRDVLIKLPGGDYSRMQLYVVGGRHYQLITEGTKEFVTSKLADDYFASFDPS